MILVERGNRTVRLTTADKAIVKQAERVLDESNKLMQLATQYRDPFGGELKMGVYSYRCTVLVAENTTIDL